MHNRAARSGDGPAAGVLRLQHESDGRRHPEPIGLACTTDFRSRTAAHDASSVSKPLTVTANTASLFEDQFALTIGVADLVLGAVARTANQVAPLFDVRNTRAVFQQQTLPLIDDRVVAAKSPASASRRTSASAMTRNRVADAATLGFVSLEALNAIHGQAGLLVAVAA